MLKNFKEFLNESKSSSLEIKDSVLIECNDKTVTSITIPDSVTSIGNGAFRYCTSLTSITIPNSVMSISNGAFWNCTKLASITIPNSVTSIGNDAFRYCTSLASITIPNSVTSIGDSTFWNCKSLASITIPESVTSIGNSVFIGCTSLASITIPNSVTSIGNNAFDGCPLKGLDLVTALLITKLSNRDVMDCVKKDIVLSRVEQQKVIKFARMHNVFDLVKPYIDDDLWHASRGSRGVLSLED